MATPSTRPHADLPELTLWAGDLHVVVEPTRLSTVLGSCISVCLFDPVLRIGGMNHFLVPTGGRDGRHGDWSTPRLIEQMLAAGARAPRIEAKIFGGASPLGLPHQAASVGPANERIAREVLAAHRIPVVAECTGTLAGMRVIFESWSGVAWQRPHAQRLPVEERAAVIARHRSRRAA